MTETIAPTYRYSKEVMRMVSVFAGDGYAGDGAYYRLSKPSESCRRQIYEGPVDLYMGHGKSVMYC
jgi:hypothetical protein